ncbi:MAG: phenylalanine--tRNA ligase subunit beta [Phycisphaerales bacterium]|nr:phenylalanine--tRNA ligase subunit beta [Planctomycetota bacterium]MCH8509475.1 phenylalanine--tRNA ligase subunit beta [Phycisphaerales bacterium]
MDISIRWLNQYLEPGNVTPDEADAILTEAGLPIESRTQLDNADTVLDVEVTSNRGDCLGHIGIAREIAAARHAATPRTLKLPEVDLPSAAGAPIADQLALENRVPDRCPLFTARLIRGVKIGPSPDWLRQALESLGQRSINNVVDVTNFITLETGNPCHVFDLRKLAGGRLIVRAAEPGEKVKTLYAGEHALRATDIVVADAERPQSLAGIIGGFDSQVDDSTTDVVFEMATWDPVAVRNTGRRLNIRTDAAYRFERGIDPRTIDAAARRAVQLICAVSRGELAGGVLEAGAPLPEDRVVELRVARVEKILGVPVPDDEMIDLLNALSIRTGRASEGVLHCTIPPHRAHDLTREIDLIEEVARARSLAKIPLKQTLAVTVHPPQREESLESEAARTLAAMGFHETVTFAFTSPKKAAVFLPGGLDTVSVDDDRRKAEPTLRPSVLLGLLGTRKANADARTALPGGLRFYELAAAFAQVPGTRDTVERRTLAVLADVEFAGKKPGVDELQHAVRVMRGAVGAVVRACYGPDARTEAVPGPPAHRGYDASAHARLFVHAGEKKEEIGAFGLISDEARRLEDLDTPVVGAELRLDVLTAAPVPRTTVRPLPQFPGIERDLSLILPESTPWSSVRALVHACDLERCVGSELVSVYRGKQVGPGRKSVTVRVRFRDDARTLRHEEVDPQLERLAARARADLGAEIRA